MPLQQSTAKWPDHHHNATTVTIDTNDSNTNNQQSSTSSSASLHTHRAAPVALDIPKSLAPPPSPNTNMAFSSSPISTTNSLSSFNNLDYMMGQRPRRTNSDRTHMSDLSTISRQPADELGSSSPTASGFGSSLTVPKPNLYKSNSIKSTNSAISTTSSFNPASSTVASSTSPLLTSEPLALEDTLTRDGSDPLGISDPVFGVTPDHIHAMLDPKTPAKLEELGGVRGLLQRLRTHLTKGLTVEYEPRGERDEVTPWWTLATGMESLGNPVRRTSTMAHSSMRLASESSTMPTLGSLENDIADANTTNEASDSTNPKVLQSLPTQASIESLPEQPLKSRDSQKEKKFDKYQLRKGAFGDNKMPEPKMKTIWEFAYDALQDKTLIILCIAAFVDIGVGIYKRVAQGESAGFVDGLAVLLAVLLIVGISSWNDWKKQGQFRKLRDFSQSLSKFQVIRGGHTRQIPTSSLLVGDICNLHAGDILPADGVLISGFNLSCDESSLTGETVAIRKDLTKDPFLLSGTKVVDGMGRFVVVATGTRSLNGRLLASLEVEPEETPLQGKLNKLADQISLMGLALTIVMVVVLLIMYFTIQPTGEFARTTISKVNDLVNLVIIGITLVVLAVPEGLPLAVVLALAHATVRMLKDQNLVRHLKACETMGNATTVCSDKTGTLTQNRMTVVRGVIASHAFGELPKVRTNSMRSRSRSPERSESMRSTSSRSSSPSISENPRVSVIETHQPHFLVAPGATPVETTVAANNMQNNELTVRSITTTLTQGFADDEGIQLLAHMQHVPKVVLSLIARAINVNCTADEVDSSSSDATKAEEAAAAEAEQRGRSKFGPFAKLLKRSKPPRQTPSGLEMAASSRSSNVQGNSRVKEFIGSKTEISLLEFTRKRLGRDYKSDRQTSEVVSVIPFSSDRKRMSTVVRVQTRDRDGKIEDALYGTRTAPEKYWLFCKGAAEIVLANCDRYVDNNGKVCPLTQEVREEFESFIGQMADSALRTICVAFKPVSHAVATRTAQVHGGTPVPTESAAGPTITVSSGAGGKESEVNVQDRQEEDEFGLIMAGILGIQDPIRPEVPDAIADCNRAGIVVRMVTGDNLATAKSIAMQAGILPPGDEFICMEGHKFRKLTEGEMDVVLPKLRVLARSSPLDKQILVNNLKRLGETVAVTGDGTNDAPALKAADVGFSMGIAGTEVAKEASDIVLLDDNFVSLSKAIVWGRSVYDSVRKFLQFQLTVNVVAVLLAMVTSFLSATLTPSKRPQSVLQAVQLLWVNLIMDTFAALALATDLPTPEMLDRPPARKSDPLISKDMWIMISSQSAYQFVLSLVIYLSYSGIFAHGQVLEDYPLGVDGRTATVVFNAFVFCQIFNEINCRVIGTKLNVFENLHKNMYFLTIMIGTTIAQIMIVELGGQAFKTQHLSAGDWMLCVALGFMSLPIGFLVRLGQRRFMKPSHHHDSEDVTPAVAKDELMIQITTSASSTKNEEIVMQDIRRSHGDDGSMIMKPSLEGNDSSMTLNPPPIVIISTPSIKSRVSVDEDRR